MDGGHAGRLELGQVEAKFVLHPGEGGCGQAEAAYVVGVDGGKLRDAGLGCGLGSRGTAAGGEEQLDYLPKVVLIYLANTEFVDCSDYKRVIRFQPRFAIYLILADSLNRVYISSEAPSGFTGSQKTEKQLLTVLQSQHRTIVGGARRSQGSHQTVGKTGTFELEGKRKRRERKFRGLSEWKLQGFALCAAHDTHLRLPSTRLGNLPPS